MIPPKTPSLVEKARLYTIHTALLGESIAEYWSYYFSNRRFPKDQEFYVVYTNMDHSISFQPNSAVDYWLVNLRFIPTSIELGGALSYKTINEIRQAYVDIAKEGCAAFREVPTIMPRFTEHRGNALHMTQMLLKPINCSPSLHTAAPFFAYNLGAKYFPQQEPKLRQIVGDIVSTVIKTKLHSMIDIAFGIFLAQKVIRDRLRLNFNDLEFFFTHVQNSKERIPYEHVYRMYHEINELEKKTEVRENNLPEIMDRYFREIGLPRVRREQSNCLYDLKQKKLVYSPKLKGGKGLF